MANDSASSPSIAVVVLGAGRSGTSATTRALAAIGVDLGDDLRPGGGKNPTGFFEDQALLEVNKRLKRALHIRGDSVRLIEDAEWDAPAIAALRAEAVERIRGRFGGRPLWGYKYGRTLRLLPFWRAVYDELGLDVRYVVALRNPLSVARSRGALDARRGTQEKSDLEWLVNVVPYFRQVRERPFVVVDYDRVMAEPTAELARIARVLALPTPPDVGSSIRAYAEEFLRPGMRHSRFTAEDLAKDPHVNPWTRRGYLWFYRFAVEEADPNDPRLWQEWEPIERAVDELRGVLLHIDRIESDVRRSQRSLLGPLQIAPQIWRKLRSG
jgi:hypothetical protein